MVEFLRHLLGFRLVEALACIGEVVMTGFEVDGREVLKAIMRTGDFLLESACEKDGYQSYDKGLPLTIDSQLAVYLVLRRDVNIGQL
jgi:hypothetical protein